MKYIIMVLFLALAFVGCDEKEECKQCITTTTFYPSLNTERDTFTACGSEVDEWHGKVVTTLSTRKATGCY